RFLWVLKTRRYPLLDGSEKKEAKLRIVSTLLGDDIPTPHDSVLIGLARVGGLLEGFLSASEIDRLSGRINQIGSVDLIAKGVESAIREEQLEVARTFLGPV
ncbi:MAG: GPP34 family phosphoprotein, partial [Steroidobacteraceae bacterium]